MQADRWANRLTDREMVGWIGGLPNGNTGRQGANRLTDRELAGWIALGGLVGGNAGRQVGKQTDR